MPIEEITDPTTVDIILKSIIAIIIAGFSFLIGHRTGRDNLDRDELRAKYKETYSHLKKISSCLNDGCTMPPSSFFKDMEKDGSIYILPNSLIIRLLETSKEWHKLCYELQQLVDNDLKDKAKSVSLKYEQTSNKVQNGKSYTRLRILNFAFMDTETVQNHISHLKNSDIGLGIELSIQNPKTEMLYSFSAVNIENILNEMHEAFIKNKNLLNVKQRTKEFSTNLDKLETDISRRIKNPHPLWETLINSIKDIFPR
ncbi:MAG: hypothetical protein ACRBCT_09315 [Alphaproteobacteria bacterium]